MKTIIILLFFTCSSLFSTEITIKAVIHKKIAGYKKGDTIVLYGSRMNSYAGVKEYLVEHKKSKKPRYIRWNYAEIYENNLTYWENVWFSKRAISYKLYRSGNYELRKKLSGDAEAYISYYSNNGQIYDNDFVTDYIFNLVQKISSDPFIKEFNYKSRVVLVETDIPFVTSFNEGTIVLSTGFIANQSDEKSLVKALAIQIAHDVLEHNLINLKKQVQTQNTATLLTTLSVNGLTTTIIETNPEVNYGYVENQNEDIKVTSGSVLNSFGANYSSIQNYEAEVIALKFIESEYSNFKQKSDKEFISIIGETITRTAWNAYHKMENEKALKYVNKIIEAGVATEDDYLLKVRLHRIFFSTEEKMKEALEYIATAKSLSVNPLIELDKEEALIYSRLGNQQKSLEAYKRYKAGLQIVQNKGQDVSEELARINEILYRGNDQ